MTRLGTFIPATRPDVGEVEQGYLLEAVRDSLSGGGSFVRRVEATLAEELGLADVILTTSGTDALELAALLLELGPEDTVIVPSFTFSSVATAFVRTGARLRFADIEPSTLGLDPDSVASLVDRTSRAVVPVHYAGMACDLDGLIEVASNHPHLTLVEDNAHGLFGTYRGRALGTFGPLGVTSFHATKTLTCGEGGALLIAEEAYVGRARIMSDKGTDRSAFLSGLVDKYTWQDIGSSFILADPLAAVLLGQLERRAEMFAARGRLHARYAELLSQPCSELGIALPARREGCEPVHHLFFVLLPSARSRDAVLADLRQRGVGASFHYVPLHSAPAAARFTDQTTPCPVTDDVARRILRLPFHSQMSDDDVEFVVEAFIDSASRHV